MKYMIPILFGALVGWTAGAAYHIAHHETLADRLEEERALRLHAEMDRDQARGAELRARLDLDTARRGWMRDRAEWWKNPAAVATEGERIPANPRNQPTHEVTRWTGHVSP